MSFMTQTNQELIYASTAPGTAKNTFTSEVTINDTAGMGPQIFLPRGFFPTGRNGSVGKTVRVVAAGIVSSTATPTFQWTVRGGASGATSGAILAQTAALATASGIANIPWTLDFTFTLEALGNGAASTIRNMTGMLDADGYSAATTTRTFPALGGGAQPGTATTFDTTIDNFINVNATCSASSASNNIQVLQMYVWGMN